MTTIEYNGINPFSGLAPTPFIAHSVSMIQYGKRWGQLDSYSFRGNITGTCEDTIEDYVSKQQLLLNRFSKDFQTLQIFDDSSEILNREFVKITDINFDDSTYARRLLPFEIKVECYPEEYFSGSFGVLEPKSEISFEEDEQGIITLTQTVSAKGFPTNSNYNNSFENAQAWVSSQTGYSSQVLPEFINFNESVCLREVSCRADRMNGSYAATLKYNSDTYDNQPGILRYTTEISSDLVEGLTNVSVKGQINGCLAQDISAIRTRYQGFNQFSEAVSQYKKYSGNTNLNSIPLRKSVGEDQTHKVITFETAYSDDPRTAIPVSYSFSFDYNYEQDVITVSVQATIKARGTYNITTWNQVKALAAAINLYSLAVPAYNEYVSIVAPLLTGYPLNPYAITTSRQENEFATEIVLGATFSNAPIPPVGLDKFEPNLSFSPAIREFAPYPILDENGNYYIFDLGFVRRGGLGIEIKSHAADNTSLSDALAQTKAQALVLQNTYLVGTKKVMEGQSFTENKIDERDISLSVGYGAEQPEFTIE